MAAHEVELPPAMVACDSSHSKSTASVLLPADEAYQVQASLDKKISGLNFNADTYEDSYNTFILFLNEIWEQKPLAYHRLMADLYKFALCTIIILIGQNMLTLRAYLAVAEGSSTAM